ncbi:MAG: DNA polymerase III subunit gamma/tau [Acidimicrobiia bacterium]|nr:DNA polymerase III subunit gamma/tau [Acidimicrobiia bacterium]
MDYQALYRKYRPQLFSEVIGQDHVTTTLSREVIEGKVAHAYLFAGPRGTGKTTTARLLAKSLNCENRAANGEPCNDCLSCASVAEGNSLDVIELDAASHNKVEDVREIRANVGTVAVAGGARKVYILDEAHMLSRAAGNALLKTLEEPPEHVIFVLATTEPYKLLDTIRSRAQRFDFLPVPVEILIDYLAEISRREGFDVTSDGLAGVATHAKGSVRDAMSLLEQVAALGGGSVEASVVARALGLADRDAFAKLAEAISNQDAPAALALVSELAARGGDLRRFVAEAMGFFRGVFLAQYAPNLEEIADEPIDTLVEWRRHAQSLSAAEVLRAVDQLSEALLHLRQGREERLVTELTLIRLTRPETSVDADALNVRLERLEQQRHSGGGAATPAVAGSGEPVPAPVPESTAVATPAEHVDDEDSTAPFEAAVEPAPTVVPDPAVPVPPDESSVESDSSLVEAATEETVAQVDIATFESAWPAIAARMRDLAGPSRHALLKEVQPVRVDDGTVVFELPAHLPFHLQQLRADRELHTLLQQAAAELMGGAVGIEFRAHVATERPQVSAAEPSRTPDEHELLDEDEGAIDPTDLVVDILGGEIIDE